MLSKGITNGAPVLDDGANLLGMLTLADIGRVPLSERNHLLVKEAMNREVLVLQADEKLDEALEKLTSHRVGWMPVIEAETTTGARHVIGRITALDITHLYEAVLSSNQVIQ